MAIVVPDEELLMEWARGKGKGGIPFEDLCKDEVG